jgi:hypothetical protein
LLIVLPVVFSFSTGFRFCSKGTIVAVPDNRTNNNDTSIMGTKIKIKIGSGTFTATLFNNETVAALKALLPMTLNMNELNSNEKYADLKSHLPVNASNPGTIQNGDLMLWGANTLVLFYKTFSTSYSYTKLGKVDDPSGLAAAVGFGNVAVSFEMP